MPPFLIPHISEIGTAIYTWQYISQITNKHLLSSTGNLTQCFVMTCMRKGTKTRVDTCLRITDSLFCTLTLTPPQNNYTPIKKKFKKEVRLRNLEDCVRKFLSFGIQAFKDSSLFPSPNYLHYSVSNLAVHRLSPRVICESGGSWEPAGLHWKNTAHCHGGPEEEKGPLSPQKICHQEKQNKFTIF